MASQLIKGPRKTGRPIMVRLLIHALLIAVTVLTKTNSVKADGGIVLLQQTAGPFIVTVFSTQSPLRTGPADLSTLVESAGEPSPIMNARVFIELRNGADAIISSEATHSQARNKLLYCSLINFQEAGNWKMKITVELGGERAEMMGDLTVARPQPMLFSYWKLFAFPPAIIILFVFNQWLRRSRSTLMN